MLLNKPSVATTKIKYIYGAHRTDPRIDSFEYPVTLLSQNEPDCGEIRQRKG